MKKQLGFTLIELMVSLLVMAVLVSIAAPGMGSLVESNSLKAQTGDILGDLRFARSEAITHMKPIVICSSQDQANCTANRNWNQGWIIFIDRNENNLPDFGTHTCAPDEDCLVKSHAALLNGLSLNADAAQTIFSKYGERQSGASVYRLCAEQASAQNDNTHSTTVRVQASGSILSLKGSDQCI